MSVSLPAINSSGPVSGNKVGNNHDRKANKQHNSSATSQRRVDSAALGRLDLAALSILDIDSNTPKGSNSLRTLPTALKNGFIPVQKAVSDVDVGANECKRTDIPLIPPRAHDNFQDIPILNFDDKEEWFVVLSPRETRGVSGPKAINDLRQMYKYGEISDSTLIWREGQDNWERLQNVNHVRFRIIQTPLVPAKAVAASGHLEALGDHFASFRRFVSDQPISRYCCVCGNIAAGHTAGVGEQIPNFSTYAPVGSTAVASEIIPGFLWIGNAASAKQNPVNEIGITLAINCTMNLKGALPAPPYFRTRVAALEEKPSAILPTGDSLNLILAAFNAAFDYIENERLYQSRQVKSDPNKPMYRGSTDKFGRPLQKDTSLMYPASRPEFEGKVPPSRILVWSRLGFDRACVISAAYLIKRWGITHSNALDIVAKCRPGTNISRLYLNALIEWSKLHSLGSMYCMDCVKVSEVEDKSRREIDAAKDVKNNSTSKVDNLLSTLNDASSALSVLDVFKDPAVFLPVVFSATDSIQSSVPNSTIYSKFQNLHDLCLYGAMLGDAGVTALFGALLESMLIGNIRNLNLDDNGITCAGISFVVNCIVPPTKNLAACLDEYLDFTCFSVANNR
jgi:hypothetical protein